MQDTLKKARELLADVTPLKTDCGKVCGAKCCRSLEEEETGMLLFPGEEELYRNREGWRILETAAGPLVVCPGTCDRAERPLSCRLFPLLPVIRGEGIRAVTDARARAVCPLARQGLRAMDPAFAEAVREAGEALAADGRQRAFLERLTAEQDELKELRKKLGGSYV